MRLWHKDLIPYLPRQQLLSQWRECCCIAKNITVNGTPNHLLVNKILKYHPEQFYLYGYWVYAEMVVRGYNVDFSKFDQWFSDERMVPELSRDLRGVYILDDSLVGKEIFPGWHNDIYLRECLYNLEEKFNCGGIGDAEWKMILGKFGDKFDLIKRKE